MADMSIEDLVKSLPRPVPRPGPTARSVSHDRTSRELVIVLKNGCTLRVPVKLIEDLADATDDQIADCSLLGAGTGLHWETLDLDLSVAGLLNGLFGTSRWMDYSEAN